MNSVAIAMYLSWGCLILSIGGLMIRPNIRTFGLFLIFMALAFWAVEIACQY